jgi:uncharacterized Zn finger protein
MAFVTKILITENNIHNWVGEAQFSRAWQYIEESLVKPHSHRGKHLSGWCFPRDNRERPYFVRVYCVNLRIREAHCTCPLGKHGICPHVAAVLLNYVREPEAFQRGIWQRCKRWFLRERKVNRGLGAQPRSPKNQPSEEIAA